MQGFLRLGDESHPVALLADGRGGYRIAGTGGVALDGGRLVTDAGSSEAIVARAGNHLWVHLDGRAYELVWQDAVAHHAGEAGGPAADGARAPMPGAVISVSVAAGDAVTAGDTLMVIESMKLETAIKAPRDGIVAVVHVAPGDVFDRDARLVSLAEEDR